MNNRLRVFIILMGTLAVAAVFTFPLWRPYVAQNVVKNVVFPGLSAEQSDAFLRLSDEQQQMLRDMLKATPTMAVAMARAATSPDIVIPTEQQGMPVLTNPSVIAGGTFTVIDALHTAKGTVTIYQLPDDSRLLRLEDFRVTNGPDLHVYLVRNPKPREQQDVGNDYIDLGALKGNVGNQNYQVPTEADLTSYRGIIIYSVQFGAIFSSAELRLS
jgi:hypothetical protein